MRSKGKFDFILLIVALLLVGVGIVMVYSTSAMVIAGDRFGDPYYFLRRQSLYAGVGFVLMIMMMFFPYGILKRFAYPIFVVSVLLLMNYTEGFVEKFTFVILLATLGTLVPYLLSALAQMKYLLGAKAGARPDRAVRSSSRNPLSIR